MKVKDLKILISDYYINDQGQYIYNDYDNLIEWLYDQQKSKGYKEPYKNLSYEHFLNFEIDDIRLMDNKDFLLVVVNYWLGKKSYTHLFIDSKYFKNWVLKIDWLPFKMLLKGCDYINYEDEHTIILKENYKRYFNNDN